MVEGESFKTLPSEHTNSIGSGRSEEGEQSKAMAADFASGPTTVTH